MQSIISNFDNIEGSIGDVDEIDEETEYKQNNVNKTLDKDIEDIFTTHHSIKEIDPVILKKMVNDILAKNIKTKDQIERLLRSFQGKKSYHVRPARSQLIKTYREMCVDSNNNIQFDSRFELLLQTHPNRSKSGVMVVAVVLSPNPNGQNFTCDWDCKYCPAQPGQPRSYLKEEPGVLRANLHKFDPILQMFARLETYHSIGHPIDKLEIIVLGGTWASYPQNYQYDFITKLYYAANIFSDEINKTAKQQNRREMQSLDEEIRLNETSKSRVIGLTLETRPDCINEKEMIKFRKMGVTRIQMGIQHINDRVLERIDRRCKSVVAINAIKTLKDNCFKVDIHIMPDLPKPLLAGVDPKDPNLEKDDIDWDFDMYETDKKMFNIIMEGEDYQADQWKIYPYQVTPFSKLEEEYNRGLHVSYVTELTENGNKLIDLLLYVKENVPKYIRLNRIIRDIPLQYIKGGCECGSLRQNLLQIMEKNGTRCKCMRCREVKDQKCNINDATLFIHKYKASGGYEYYISYENPDETILYGFLRLRVSENTGFDKQNVVFQELVSCALIRELHVYGTVINVGADASQISSQHVGFGTKLLIEAERIAKNDNFAKIAVISGVGVREYYRKRGYVDGEYFLFKNI